MKNFVLSLIAVAALSLGGVFSSSAKAQHGGHGRNHGHNHGGHNHGGHNHGGHNYGHHGHNHGHFHNHGHAHHQHHNHGYNYRPYGYGVQQRYYYPSNSFYLQGRNYGIGFGF